MVQDYTEYLEKIILTEKQIQDRIKELGAEISRDYQGKELLIICIFKGWGYVHHRYRAPNQCAFGN